MRCSVRSAWPATTRCVSTSLRAILISSWRTPFSWAIRESRFAHENRKRSCLGLWFSWILHCRNIDTAMALQQALMSDRQEREARVVVFVIDLHALGEP